MNDRTYKTLEPASYSQSSEEALSVAPVEPEPYPLDWKQGLKTQLETQLIQVEQQRTSRYLSFVRTNIEEAIMWLDKEIQNS